MNILELSRVAWLNDALLFEQCYEWMSKNNLTHAHNEAASLVDLLNLCKN